MLNAEVGRKLTVKRVYAGIGAGDGLFGDVLSAFNRQNGGHDFGEGAGLRAHLGILRKENGVILAQVHNNRFLTDGCLCRCIGGSGER